LKTILLVPVFNIEDIFKDWSERIYKLDPKPGKVVFCENNSTDKTLELLYTFGNKQGISTEVIRFWTLEPKSLPFKQCYDTIAHARQLLLARARQLDPDYAIFIDSDILINTEDMIEALTLWDQDIVGGAYLRYFPEGKYIGTLFWSPVDAAKNRLRNYMKYAFEDVLATSAGCLCLSRKIIQDRRVNFWPLLKGYSEDFGYCKKARDLGYKIYLDGTVSLTHRIRGKWKAWNMQWAKKDGRL